MDWNAYVNIRANGKLNDSHWEEVKQWAEVEKIWTTQGHWDWMVKLRHSVKSHDDLEKVIFNLRGKPWISETSTWWAKEV
jgi:hypothetical protein